MPEKKRRIAAVDAGQFMKSLREQAPRLLEGYGSTRKLAAQFGISRADALDLCMLALIQERRKPLQARKEFGRRKTRTRLGRLRG